MRMIGPRSWRAGLALLVAAPRALAVEGGVEDRTTTHAVAVVRGGPSAPDVRCSGTLVSSNVVLTARHCVSAAAISSGCDGALGALEGSAGDYWVTPSPWATPEGTFGRVADVVLPVTTRPCGDDIALLVLEAPFDARAATPARPVVHASELATIARGRLAGLSGFGASGPTANDVGLRRVRWDLPLKCVPGDLSFACGAELDDIDARELTTGPGACHGDSGAGALAPGDPGVVFGVLSRNRGGNCADGVFVRTDAWAWLVARTVIDRAPRDSGPPAWATEVFPAAPRAGEACVGDASCGTSAECVSLDGQRSFVCADRCIDGDCSEGHHCESGVCVTGAAPEVASAGCAVRRPRDRRWDAPALGVLALCAVVALRRRRQ